MKIVGDFVRPLFSVREDREILGSAPYRGHLFLISVELPPLCSVPEYRARVVETARVKALRGLAEQISRVFSVPTVLS